VVKGWSATETGSSDCGGSGKGSLLVRVSDDLVTVDAEGKGQKLAGRAELGVRLTHLFPLFPNAILA